MTQQISPVQGATDSQRRHYDTTVPGQYRPPTPSYKGITVRPPAAPRFTRFLEAGRLAMIAFVTLVIPVGGTVAFVAAVEHKNSPRGAGSTPVVAPMPAPAVASASAPVAAGPPAPPAASVRSYLPGHSPAPRAATDPATGLQAPVGPGTYQVGQDLTPGVYTTQGREGASDTCHYRRSTDAAGQKRIVNDDRVTGTTTITVYATEYLATRGCKKWIWKAPPA